MGPSVNPGGRLCGTCCRCPCILSGDAGVRLHAQLRGAVRKWSRPDSQGCVSQVVWSLWHGWCQTVYSSLTGE